MDEQNNLQQTLADVLELNNKGTHTTPAAHLYPHQWLWDSCFIAIGLRHIDVKKAQTEIESLFRGQWSNGLMPNMIFSDDRQYSLDRKMWSSHLSPFSPGDYATSGITQPPVIAEAIVRVGEKMKKTERIQWYKKMLPKLVAYHEWLFRDRDPHKGGLTIQVHPYESGMDNSPPWIIQLHEQGKPWWISFIEKTNLDKAVNLVRRDTTHVNPGQRMSNIDALLYWNIIRRFKSKSWDIDKMLHKGDFMLEDLAFNSIFTRANQILLKISNETRVKLPEELVERIAQNKKAIEEMWSEQEGRYFSRDFITRKPIEELTVASLLPLYTGVISKERAESLVKLLKDTRHFGMRYPAPSVPVSSDFYSPDRFWQGPSWLNTNWLIIDGLKQFGYIEEANALTKTCIDLLEKSGAFEYFNPQSGEGLGAKEFSWTAALGIDLINTKS